MKNIIVSVALIFSFVACAQNDFPVNESFTHEVVTKEITLPWGIDFLPNGDMLVTDKSGKLYRVVGGTVTEITGTPKVLFEGQGGLLDIAVHPDYAKNGWIYLSYSKGGKKDKDGKELGTTAIVRAKIEGNKLVGMQEVFE
ncbi:MAG: PQQ-dependent sugar dehydrogenase, partial [Cyclobacteriaceae bacterium]